MHISKIPHQLPLSIRRKIQQFIETDNVDGILDLDLRAEGYMIREYGPKAKKAGQLYFRKTQAREPSRPERIYARSESSNDSPEPKSRKTRMREAASTGETSKAIEILTTEMKERKVQVLEEEDDEDDDVLSQYMRRSEMQGIKSMLDSSSSAIKELQAQLAQQNVKPEPAPEPIPEAEPEAIPEPEPVDPNKELLASFGMYF